MKYQPIIGLEVHVELATLSKMFCGCSADHFGKKPNTQTCPVCLGLPGALPVPNKKAVEWTILLGLALSCTIPEESKFDRKNYFYPDLPKGYQISQYDMPLCVNGKLDGIRIRRVHLEEDTGKLQHQDDMTLIDFNRSGVPLVEIVTEPDFRTIEQVDEFLKKLQQTIRYLGISNADMEKGSMRIEPSISLSTDGKLPSYRVELKNINSFRFARKALEYEIERQQKEPHVQQTRGWNESKNATVPQREKEQAHDYRYFLEPDIPPMRFAQAQISKLKAQIPELPEEKKERFIKEYKLSEYDASLLTETHEKASFFEACVQTNEVSPKIIANWIINKKIDMKKPEDLIRSIQKSINVQDISEELIHKVIAENPKAVEDYKKGKSSALMYLVGQAKRQSPNLNTEILIERLKKLL